MNETAKTNLVEAAIQGDLDSFGLLAAEHYRPMVAAAYAVLADTHMAEDAVQDAYRKALVKLPTLRDPSRFAQWLTRICRNTALDMLRRNKQTTLDPDRHPAPCPEPTDRTHAVRRAIDSLPAAFRELIMLRYYSDMSLDRIAEMVASTPAAVNGRLTRARKKIAQYLRNTQFQDDQP